MSYSNNGEPIWNVRNSKQIPSEDWGSAIMRIYADSVARYYTYEEELDQWLPIPVGSDGYTEVEKMWNEQLVRRNNAVAAKTSIQKGP